MPTWNTIGVFLAATAILVVTPGPIVLYLMACSLERGRKAGLIAILGVGAGTLVHVIAAAIGLSAILMSSSWGFKFVKYAGAIYLIYLGIKTLLDRRTLQVESQRHPNRHLFTQSALMNILNPKTALFFLAWLPRFIEPDRGSVALQSLILGCLVILLGFCNDSAYVLLAGMANRWLQKKPKFWVTQRYFSGSIYLLLGVTAAFTKL